MTKFSFSFSLLLASISLLSASSGVAADSGLLSPRDHPAGDLFTRKHHHKQQAAKRQSSSTLSFTGTSKNGKPYPEAGDKPPALDTIPQAWIDAYNKVSTEEGQDSVRWKRNRRWDDRKEAIRKHHWMFVE